MVVGLLPADGAFADEPAVVVEGLFDGLAGGVVEEDGEGVVGREMLLPKAVHTTTPTGDFLPDARRTAGPVVSIGREQAVTSDGPADFVHGAGDGGLVERDGLARLVVEEDLSGPWILEFSCKATLQIITLQTGATRLAERRHCKERGQADPADENKVGGEARACAHEWRSFEKVGKDYRFVPVGAGASSILTVWAHSAIIVSRSSIVIAAYFWNIWSPRLRRQATKFKKCSLQSAPVPAGA